MIRGFVLLGTIVCSLGSSTVRADERELLGQSPAVPAYREVTSGISRGGRPGTQGLTDLRRMGVRTVINLENENQPVAAERGLAAQLGLSWVSEPMSASAVPNDAEVMQVLSLLQDARRYPIFVHCHFGEDRTGLIIGLYRVLAQRWTAQQAYNEMLQDGFHPQFQGMVRYFQAKTAGH
jgi:protein tyrosine/serine phosphatase